MEQVLHLALQLRVVFRSHSGDHLDKRRLHVLLAPYADRLAADRSLASQEPLDESQQQTRAVSFRVGTHLLQHSQRVPSDAQRLLLATETQRGVQERENQSQVAAMVLQLQVASRQRENGLDGFGRGFVERESGLEGGVGQDQRHGE